LQQQVPRAAAAGQQQAATKVFSTPPLLMERGLSRFQSFGQGYLGKIKQHVKRCHDGTPN